MAIRPSMTTLSTPAMAVAGNSSVRQVMRGEEEGKHAGVREHLRPGNGESGGQEESSQRPEQWVDVRKARISPLPQEVLSMSPAPRLSMPPPDARQRDTIYKLEVREAPRYEYLQNCFSADCSHPLSHLHRRLFWRPEWHGAGLPGRRGDELFQLFLFDKLALSMYRAQPVTREQLPRVYQIVERILPRMGLPMPRIYVIPSDSPNAFATGRNPNMLPSR